MIISLPENFVFEDGYRSPKDLAERWSISEDKLKSMKDL